MHDSPELKAPTTMSESPELKAPTQSSPWNITFGERPGRYDATYDNQPMTPPGDMDLKEPPKFKPRRRSKYQDLLGEHFQIPERNEDPSYNLDERKFSLSLVTSNKIPVRESVEQTPVNMSTEVKEKVVTTSDRGLESPLRGSDRTPTGDSLLQMLEKSSSIKQKQLRRASSTSDLDSIHSDILKEVLSKKEVASEKPHIHTEDCNPPQILLESAFPGQQPSQSSLEKKLPIQRSASSAELSRHKADVQVASSPLFRVIKTRLSASAEAAQQARMIVEKNSKKSNLTPAAVPPKPEPELHKNRSLFDFFNTRRVNVTGRDSNVWAPTSF